MRKLRIDYDSPVDALVAIAKRLSNYEMQYQMESEAFLIIFPRGCQKTRRILSNGLMTTSIILTSGEK